MSNYHVLAQDLKSDSAQVAFHIAVPVETNAAGVYLSVALRQHLAPATQVPWLVDPELTGIANGDVYEYLQNVEFSALLSVAEKRAIIDARYTALAAAIPNIIRDRYRFWGLDRDV